MEREDQDFYDDLMEMFATKGWKIFVDKVGEELHKLEITSYTDCVDNDLWQERRGEIKKCITVVSYESLIRQDLDSVVRSEKSIEQENLH